MHSFQSSQRNCLPCFTICLYKLCIHGCPCWNWSSLGPHVCTTRQPELSYPQKKHLISMEYEIGKVTNGAHYSLVIKSDSFIVHLSTFVVNDRMRLALYAILSSSHFFGATWPARESFPWPERASLHAISGVWVRSDLVTSASSFDAIQMELCILHAEPFLDNCFCSRPGL